MSGMLGCTGRCCWRVFCFTTSPTRGAYDFISDVLTVLTLGRSLSTWAYNEAKRRMEERGEKTDYP